MGQIIILLAFVLASPFCYSQSIKEGYYFDTGGHVSILVKITEDRIEWYRDNSFKVWSSGKFKLNLNDSTILISFDRIKVSRNFKSSEAYNRSYPIEFDRLEGVFKLKDLRYREESTALLTLIQRVKRNCKKKVSRI